MQPIGHTEHTCIISLGSNLGDRSGYFQNAKRQLRWRLSLLLESSIYETEPWGYLDQPKFLNQVIVAETALTPLELLKFLKHIEARIGREKTILNGPRTIDLDILFYDQIVVNLPGLKIPHPAIAERAFILVPLAEVAGEMIHPVSNITADEMLSRVDQSGVYLFKG